MKAISTPIDFAPVSYALNDKCSARRLERKHDAPISDTLSELAGQTLHADNVTSPGCSILVDEAHNAVANLRVKAVQFFNGPLGEDNDPAHNLMPRDRAYSSRVIVGSPARKDFRHSSIARKSFSLTGSSSTGALSRESSTGSNCSAGGATLQVCSRPAGSATKHIAGAGPMADIGLDSQANAQLGGNRLGVDESGKLSVAKPTRKKTANKPQANPLETKAPPLGQLRSAIIHRQDGTEDLDVQVLEDAFATLFDGRLSGSHLGEHACNCVAIAIWALDAGISGKGKAIARGIVKRIKTTDYLRYGLMNMIHVPGQMSPYYEVPPLDVISLTDWADIVKGYSVER